LVCHAPTAETRGWQFGKPATREIESDRRLALLAVGMEEFAHDEVLADADVVTAHKARVNTFITNYDFLILIVERATACLIRDHERFAKFLV
jgi:hypothetical protein